MKYFGEPHLTIIDYKKGNKVFQFDEKGEYQTEDEKLIKWMKENKWFIKYEDKEIKTENNAESEKIKKPKSRK